jgi:hypothetical protein
MGLGGMEWIYLAQDTHFWRALVNTVMKLHVALFEKLFSSCTTGRFSGRAQLHEVIYSVVS